MHKSVAMVCVAAIYEYISEKAHMKHLKSYHTANNVG